MEAVSLQFFCRILNSSRGCVKGVVRKVDGWWQILVADLFATFGGWRIFDDDVEKLSPESEKTRKMNDHQWCAYMIPTLLWYSIILRAYPDDTRTRKTNHKILGHHNGRRLHLFWHLGIHFVTVLVYTQDSVPVTPKETPSIQVVSDHRCSAATTEQIIHSFKQSYR